MAAAHPGEVKDVELQPSAPSAYLHDLHATYIKEWEANKDVSRSLFLWLQWCACVRARAYVCVCVCAWRTEVVGSLQP